MDLYSVSTKRLELTTPSTNTTVNRMAENRTICRLCLGNTDDFTSILYTGNKYNTPPSIMIKSLFPEMYTGVSQNPVICYDCLEELYKCWQFRQKCLRTENRIVMYLNAMNRSLASINLDSVVLFLKKIGEIKDDNDNGNPDVADCQSDTAEKPYNIVLNKNLKEYVDSSKNTLVTFNCEKVPAKSAPEKPNDILKKNLKTNPESSKDIMVPEQPLIEKPHTPRLKPIDISKLMDPNKINMFGMDISGPKKPNDKYVIRPKSDCQDLTKNVDFNPSENFFNNECQKPPSEMAKPRVLNKEITQCGLPAGFEFDQDVEEELESSLPRSYIFKKKSSGFEGTSQDNSQENRAVGPNDSIIIIKDEPFELNDNYGSSNPILLNALQTFGETTIAEDAEGMPFMTDVSAQDDTDDEFCEGSPDPKKISNILRHKPNLSSQKVRLEKEGKKRTRIRKRLKLVPIDDNEESARCSTAESDISPQSPITLSYSVPNMVLQAPTEMGQLYFLEGQSKIISKPRQTTLKAGNSENIELNKSGTPMKQIQKSTMGPTLQAPMEMRQGLEELKNNSGKSILKVKQTQGNSVEDTFSAVGQSHIASAPNQNRATQTIRLSVKQPMQNVAAVGQNASTMDQNQLVSTQTRPNVITVGNHVYTMPQYQLVSTQTRPNIMTVKHNTSTVGQKHPVSTQMGQTDLIYTQNAQNVTEVGATATALDQNKLFLTQARPNVTKVGLNVPGVEQTQLVSKQTRQNRSVLAQNRLASTQTMQNVTTVGGKLQPVKEMSQSEIPKGVGYHVIVQEPAVQEIDDNLVGKVLQDPNKLKSYNSPKEKKILVKVFGTEALEMDPKYKETAVLQKQNDANAKAAALKKKEEIIAKNPKKKVHESGMHDDLTFLGDYIQDHDYLASPYVRNKIYYKCYNGMYLCCCLICDILHNSDDHLEHMSSHDTVCEICQRDLVNAFALNIHVKSHIKKCNKCHQNITYPMYHTHSQTCKIIYMIDESSSFSIDPQTYETILKNKTLPKEIEEKLQPLEISDSDDDVPLINLILKENEKLYNDQFEDDLPLINLLPSEKRRKSLMSKKEENYLEKSLVESYSHITLNISEECITSGNQEDLKKISLEDLLKHQPFVYLDKLQLPDLKVIEFDSSGTETADSDAIDNFETLLDSVSESKRKGNKYSALGKKRRRKANRIKKKDDTNKISSSQTTDLVKNPFSTRRGTRSSTRLRTRQEEFELQDISEPTPDGFTLENVAQNISQRLEDSIQPDHDRVSCEADELDKDIAHMDEEIHNLGLDITEIEKSMENVIKNVIQNVGAREELTSETNTELELCEKEIERLKIEIDTLKNMKKTKKIKKVPRMLKNKSKAQTDIPNDCSMSQQLDMQQNLIADLDNTGKQERSTTNANLSSEETLHLNMVEDSLENIENDNESCNALQKRSENVEQMTRTEKEITTSNDESIKNIENLQIPDDKVSESDPKLTNNDDTQLKSVQDIENLDISNDKVLADELDHKLSKPDSTVLNNPENATKSLDFVDKITENDSYHEVTDLNTTEPKVASETQYLTQHNPNSLEKLDGETMEEFFKRIEKISQDNEMPSQPRTRKRTRKSYAFELDITKKRRKPKINESDKELSHNNELSHIVDEGSSISINIQSETAQTNEKVVLENKQELIHTVDKSSSLSTSLRQEITENDEIVNLAIETEKKDSIMDIQTKTGQNDDSDVLSTQNLPQKLPKNIRTQKDGETIKKFRKKTVFSPRKQKRRNKLRQAILDGAEENIFSVATKTVELEPGREFSEEKMETKVKTKPKKVVKLRTELKPSASKPRKKIESKSNRADNASDPYDFETELLKGDESPSKLRETPNTEAISSFKLKNEPSKVEKDLKRTEINPTETLQSILLSMMPDVQKNTVSTVKKNITKIKKKSIIMTRTKSAKTMIVSKKRKRAPVKKKFKASSIDTIIKAVSKYKENENNSAECHEASDLIEVSNTVSEELKKGPSTSKRSASVSPEGKSRLKIKKDTQSPSNSSTSLNIVSRNSRKNRNLKKDFNLSNTKIDLRETTSESEAPKKQDKIIKKRKLINKKGSYASTRLANKATLIKDKKLRSSEKDKSTALDSLNLDTEDTASKQENFANSDDATSNDQANDNLKPVSDKFDVNMLEGNTSTDHNNRNETANNNSAKDLKPVLDKLNKFKEIKVKKITSETTSEQDHIKENKVTQEKKDIGNMLQVEHKLEKIGGTEVKKIILGTTSEKDYIKENEHNKQENKGNTIQERIETKKVLHELDKEQNTREGEIAENVKRVSFSSGTSNADMESLFLEEESGSDPEKVEIPDEPPKKVED